MILHFLGRALSDTASGLRPILAARPEDTDHAAHLTAGANWLLRSIDACGGEASSKGYRFLRGWMPPYPETTGYIIPTLLALGDRFAQARYADAAGRMGQWLTGVQRPDGGFAGYELGLRDEPDVFDTGMILLGFNALLRRSPTPEIRASAKRAADFLREALDQEGAFARHVSHRMLHAYNVRSAWALVAYGRIAGDAGAEAAGLANADWVLAHQQPNGFFTQNAFKPGGNANTHGTAYVMRGLFQIHQLTGRRDILESVVRAADPLADAYDRHGWLAAELGPDWGFRSRHICLTGCAQIAIVFLRLAAATGNERYVPLAERLIAQVAATQALKGTMRHSGAIAGSYPIQGAYAPLQYPNWATKFFVDALLERERWHKGDRALPEAELFAG
ncbi:hypothetical protein OEW28_04150 [Defluviimonas sp. WL0002]|uniref:Squalene cyclase C-terminal domain-containing protein n=1 Tax=Albidovulum marisflavi TaxID=2984159 RepID=A0ABT2ZAK7_9RHOB|nr:hypothetical protein [Defluviimonas sp. WL0002]MCV2867811.1 hypothetical protein [Defluviimonas sp. WL0002]